MKSKTIIIIISLLALVELIIIIGGLFYLPYECPFIFYQKRPAVIVIDIQGEIISTQFGGILDKRGRNHTVVTSASNIVRMLDYFSDDPYIKGFILEIDSNGGESAGDEEIVRQIKRMEQPVVAVIRDSALSSGYFVAAGTDRIFANKRSNVADIGLVSAYINRNRNGTYQECYLSSTIFKTMYTDNVCPDFENENVLKLKHYLEVSHELLIYDIAELRNLPIEHVRKLSDGTIYKGAEALRLGLIDEIGDTQDAKEWIENQLGMQLEIIYLREALSRIND